MELKLSVGFTHTEFVMLLIVPYGIETNISVTWYLIGILLLIVPYGIETGLSWTSNNSRDLLIVPYGIETEFLGGFLTPIRAFNCTLWNWNNMT